MKLLAHAYDDDLPANPDNWTAHDLIAVMDARLPPDEKIRRAFAHFQFKVRRIEQLPVHRIQIVHFYCQQNMGLCTRTLAKALRDALVFHAIEFNRESLVVHALGKRGRLTFISNESLQGEVLLR